MRFFLKPKLTGWRQAVRHHLHDLLALLYPALCPACDHHLLADEQHICASCQYKLPSTGYHLLADNPFTERFWGRLPLHSAAALYHFTKGGRTQKLIHQIKYGRRPQIAHHLGRVYGVELRASPLFSTIDYIVPVPLHPRRQHQRGYNQSDHFARGLSETMSVDWSPNVLIRRHATTSQTRKSRMERFSNVQEVFQLAHPERVVGRHILLVDDVITTGATLEACGQQLLQLPHTRLSMATLAFAN